MHMDSVTTAALMAIITIVLAALGGALLGRSVIGSKIDKQTLKSSKLKFSDRKQDNFAVFESGILFFIIAFFLFSGLVWGIFHGLEKHTEFHAMGKPETAMHWLGLTGVSVFFLLLMVYRIWQVFKRRSQPVMTLHNDGVELPSFGQRIPWSQVKSVTFKGNSFFQTTIRWSFEDDFKTAFIKKARTLTKYNARKKLYTVKIFGLRGVMSDRALKQNLAGYMYDSDVVDTFE